MNKKFTKLIAALALLVFMTPSMVGWGQTTSTLTLSSSKKFGTSSGSTLQTETTPKITWTVTKTSGSGAIQNSYISDYHGQQFGTSNNVWGGTFSATYDNTVTSVKVDANTGGSATLSVTVGGTSFICGTSTTVNVVKNSSSSGANYYEFTGSGSGAVVISLTGISKACYFGGVVVTYSSGPTISVSPTSLTGMTYSQGSGPSTSKSFSASGSNLTADFILVQAPEHYELSKDNETYKDTLHLVQHTGTVDNTTIYARLRSGLNVGNYNSENVSLTSDGATEKSVSLSGSVTGYTVTYNCNGATSGCPENATNVTLGDYTIASAPSKNHYNFGGWNDGTNTYNAGATYNITGNVTFTAQWTPKTHTFNTAVDPANSGSIVAKNSSNETVESGSAVAETAQLTLTANPAEGYNFTSWSDGGNNSTLSSTTANPTTFTMGTSNVTITATFTARTPATVTLHHGEGGSTTTVVNTYTDATVGDLMAPATVNGWTTMGWVLNYTSGDPELLSSSTLIDAIDNDNHELTLYAVYTKGSNTFSRITSTNDVEVDGTYMICYHNGSSFRFMNDENGSGFMAYTTGNSVSNYSYEYKAGKKFVLGGTTGAYTFNDGSNHLTATENTQKLGLSSDTPTNYGKWSIDFSGDNVTITNNGHTAASYSYTLLSYHTSQNYFNIYSSASKMELYKQITNDLQITTSPIAEKCTVTYDVNGGSGDAPIDNTQYNVGASVTVEQGTGLSKTGYLFNGWNTKADGTGTAHAAGSTFNITVNTTLYAQWAINSYAYTLNVTGADTGASAVLKVDNENVGENAQIQYNKEVTVVVTLSDAEAYVYTVSVVNNTTSEAVTVSNNKFTMPDSPVTVTVTTVVNPYRNAILSSDDIKNMTPATTNQFGYGYIKTKTTTANSNTYQWETNGYQHTNNNVVDLGMVQLRIRTNTNGVSYVKLPLVPGKIETIDFAVSGNGNNDNTPTSSTTTTKLLFQAAATSDGEVIAEGGGTATNTITISLVNKFYSTGYIVADGGIRIWSINITYLPYNNFTDLNPGEPMPTLSAGDNYAVATNMTTDNLTIPATAGLVVKSGAKLTITGTLTNSGTAANLVVLDGGQLNATSANVAATMKKTITGHENNLGGGWNFIASPMTSTVIANTAHTNVITGNYDLYRFNQSAELEWENYEAVVENTTQPLHTDFTTLVNGTGYLYANDTTIDVAFMGTLANPTSGDVSVSYDGYAALKGWNLVGNPFTCNAYLSGGFYTTGEPGAVVVACENTTPIAPCEGAMVYVESAGTVTFSKTAPRTANNGNVSIAVVQANERGASATTVDKAIVSFNEGSELPKFYFGTPNANLYIPQNDKEYAIATSEAQGEMPLNFRANADGQYTLTVNPEGVEMNYLHLIDNMTGNDIDLLQTPSYSFNAKTTDYESRFRLVFAANNESGVSASSTTFAFYSNGNWMVNNEGEATLQVIDVMGRVLSNQTISGTAELSLNQQAGVYVLRLVNGNDVKTQKIVVK